MNIEIFVSPALAFSKFHIWPFDIVLVILIGPTNPEKSSWMRAKLFHFDTWKGENMVIINVDYICNGMFHATLSSAVADSWNAILFKTWIKCRKWLAVPSALNFTNSFDKSQVNEFDRCYDMNGFLYTFKTYHRKVRRHHRLVHVMRRYSWRFAALIFPLSGIECDQIVRPPSFLALMV